MNGLRCILTKYLAGPTSGRAPRTDEATPTSAGMTGVALDVYTRADIAQRPAPRRIVSLSQKRNLLISKSTLLGITASSLETHSTHFGQYKLFSHFNLPHIPLIQLHFR